jgi:ankyrin repeat protein
MDLAATASLLLEHGADIESRREDGSTPLIEAADHGGTRVVKLLLKRGAHIDARNNRGNTALMAAACGCAIIDMPDTFDSMKLLLEKGAKVNAKNGEGSTARMFAAGWGRARIVQLLLDKGANIDIKNGDGNTALMVSALGGGNRTADATKVLLAGGAEIEARNNGGATALILAASSGYDDAEIVKLPFDKGERRCQGQARARRARTGVEESPYRSRFSSEKGDLRAPEGRVLLLPNEPRDRIFGKCCQGKQESRSRFLFVTVAELKTVNCEPAILRLAK